MAYDTSHFFCPSFLLHHHTVESCIYTYIHTYIHLAGRIEKGRGRMLREDDDTSSIDETWSFEGNPSPSSSSSSTSTPPTYHHQKLQPIDDDMMEKGRRKGKGKKKEETEGDKKNYLVERVYASSLGR